MTVPGFFARLGLLPFRPDLWSRAAGWRLRDVLLPLVALALLAFCALGTLRAVQTSAEISGWIRRYDSSHPAVTLSGGRVSVDGNRVIRWEQEGKTTLLVDPLETVDTDSITTPEYLVVRETRILRKRPFTGTEVTELADLQSLLPDPLRIDGASLRSFHSRWGLVLGAALVALLMVFMVVRDGIGLVVFAPIAAVIASKLIGNGRLGFSRCLNVAVAAYTPLLVLHLVLNVFGSGPGACTGLWLWPVLLTGLAYWRSLAAADQAPPDPVATAAAPRAAAGSLAAPVTPRAFISRQPPPAARSMARRAPPPSRLPAVVGIVAIAAGLLAIIVVVGNRLLSPDRVSIRTRLALEERFERFAGLSRPEMRKALDAAHASCFRPSFQLGLLSARLDDRTYSSCIDRAIGARLLGSFSLHSPELAVSTTPGWWKVDFVIERRGDDEIPDHFLWSTESRCRGKATSSNQTVSARQHLERIDDRNSRSSVMLFDAGPSCEHRIVLAVERWALGPALLVRTPARAEPGASSGP